jgi:hypothetical protein
MEDSIRMNKGWLGIQGGRRWRLGVLQAEMVEDVHFLLSGGIQCTKSDIKLASLGIV